MQWIESSTIRAGIATRAVDDHPDETRVVCVTRIKLARNEAADVEPPERFEPCAPLALLDL